MILTLVAMLSMTTAFAEGEKANDQKEAVADIHHTFASELKFAAQYANNDRKALVARAIDNDVKWMRYVLNDKQFRTYLTLLNTTLNNRGIRE